MQAVINGIRQFWREEGSGDPLLFLHAFPLNSSMWEPQLNALPSGWRGLAPDLRGFGRTENDASGPTTMDRFADDVIALMDHLGLDQAPVCGLSMGGYIAFAIQRKYPERVRALILCNTRPTADTEEGKAARKDLAARVRARGAIAVVEAMMSKLLSAHAQEAQPELSTRVQQMIMANAPEQIARALEGLAERPNSEPLFASITCPVLVIHGEDDAIIPRGDAQIMARGIRGARLQIVPDAGHLSNLEHPAVFSSFLNDFLQHLPPQLNINTLKLA